MKFLLFCVVLVFSVEISKAQKSPILFGNISLQDLKMQVYDKDSSASAVVLTEYGKAWVLINTVGELLYFECHVRIKILTKDGLGAADVAIPLFHSSDFAEEKITNFKASTYNLENGRVVETKMNKSSMFAEKFNRNITLQKFTFPNVKEGSVIEYSYTKVSDFLSNFPNWQFQRQIPVRHSEYIARIPEFFVMERFMQGYLTPTTYEVKEEVQPLYSETTYHWIMKDVPAFTVEPYMTSEDDYISKIKFALAFINIRGQAPREVMGSWEKFRTRLLEFDGFGKAITGSYFLKKVADDLITGKTEPRQKIEAIYDYVKNTVEWNGISDRYTDNLKQVMDVKKGTAADINILLASMLEKVGINVDMVLLSTRSHGFVRKEYPMQDQFDYVVCLVEIDGKSTFLDATEKYLPLGVLPERCLNGEGFIISEKNMGWVSLNSKTKSRTVYTSDLKIMPAGELIGKLSISRDGYDAIEMRNKYYSIGETEYLKKFGEKQPTWVIEKSEFQNMKEINKIAKENHDLRIQGHASVAGDVMYLNPYVIGQLGSNPFVSDAREFPVDYGSPQEIIYSCQLTLPEGYVADELPQSKVLTLPGNIARYAYSVTEAGGKLNIASSFQINRSIYLPTEYPSLREFYNLVVAKEAEQIVLKKK